MTFTQFQLDPRVAAGVQACGYEVPTPVQQQTIPPAMQGLDVMGLAQTGTGKTAAYALPILHRLLSGRRGALRALVLAPTRELAEQICGAVRELGPQTRLTATTIYGGVGIGPQIQALRRGVDVAVACPGRLLDHMKQRTIDLRNLEVLVLDEADMMLDMGFLPDVRRILGHLPPRRQNLMFSATMPDDIRKLAAEILSEPVTVKIRHSKPVETVSHALYPVAQHLKTPLLLELLKKTDTESVLVFTRTKHRAKKVGAQLVKQGYKCASLQGNLSQSARQAALSGFRKGKYDILVATDIAARGIDIAQVSHVINYDIPDTADAYTHRIGRTGRALRTGDAFTLLTREDEGMVRDIEKILGARIERRTMEGFDYRQAAPPRDPGSARPSRQSERRQPERRQTEPRKSEPRQQPQPRSAQAPRRAERHEPSVPRESSTVFFSASRPHIAPAGDGRSAGRRDSRRGPGNPAQGRKTRAGGAGRWGRRSQRPGFSK